MDFLLAVIQSDITPYTGLLALGLWIIRKIGRGDWIPVATHERIVGTMTEAYHVQAGTVDRLNAQVAKMAETGETTLHLLRSIAPGSKDQP